MKLHYTTIFSEYALNKALQSGLVVKRKHPVLDIFIYNYTATTQFSWEWNDVTMNCRGLVLDSEGYILARSFPKFFSYEQLEGNLPSGNYTVYEKLDGSMLIAFLYNGELITATRGSFESDQAISARKYLDGHLLFEGYSYIFEYIAKDNRIVVDYGNFEGLVSLGAVALDGKIIPPHKIKWTYGKEFRLPLVFNFSNLEDILKFEKNNFEGFVLWYKSGEMVKFKTEEYKKLHKVMTGLNERHIWEALKDNKFEELLDLVPDEMYDWVQSTKQNILYELYKIWVVVGTEMKDLGDRKANAMYYKTCTYPHLLFLCLDGKYKELDSKLYDMVRPSVTKTYRVDLES